MLKNLIVLAAVGYVAWRWLEKPRHLTRSAQPEPRRLPRLDSPKDWDRVDERSDESFPASDPPGTY